MLTLLLIKRSRSIHICLVLIAILIPDTAVKATMSVLRHRWRYVSESLDDVGYGTLTKDGEILIEHTTGHAYMILLENWNNYMDGADESGMNGENLERIENSENRSSLRKCLKWAVSAFSVWCGIQYHHRVNIHPLVYRRNQLLTGINQSEDKHAKPNQQNTLTIK